MNILNWFIMKNPNPMIFLKVTFVFVFFFFITVFLWKEFYEDVIGLYNEIK